MMRKTCMTILLCIFIFSFFSVACSETIDVDESGGKDYTSIQDAVNASDNGDTIYVYSGEYVENIDIDKSIKLIGEDRDTTIIDGGGSGSVVYISGDNVEIYGFTIQNSGTWVNDAGIRVASSYNIVSNSVLLIEENDGIVIGYPFGFIASPANNNKIFGNLIEGNTEIDALHSGIALGLSFDNEIYNNNIRNYEDGIYLYDSTNNTIHNNTVTNMGSGGIYLSESSNNNIYDNTLSSNKYGIEIWSTSENNTISGNTIKNSGEFGIWLLYSEYNTISANTIKNSKIDDIYFSEDDSPNNTIEGNDVTERGETKTPGFELILAVCAIAFVFFWKRKRI